MAAIFCLSKDAAVELDPAQFSINIEIRSIEFFSGWGRYQILVHILLIYPVASGLCSIVSLLQTSRQHDKRHKKTPLNKRSSGVGEQGLEPLSNRKRLYNNTRCTFYLHKFGVLVCTEQERHIFSGRKKE